MWKQLFKQLWNERKNNLLIWLELFVVSVFLWYAADALYVYYKLYSQPVGFDISNVYHVELAVVPAESADYDTTALHSTQGGADFLTIYDRLAHNPKVEAVCYTTGNHFHYKGGNRFATFKNDTLTRNGYVRNVDPAYFRVFRVKTAQGGAPEELEQALRENTVVVTGTVADSFFGSASKAMKQELQITDQSDSDSVIYRIGAVSEPQRYSDFQEFNYAYYKMPSAWEDPRTSGAEVAEGLNLFIRVKPAADNDRFAADFRREMSDQLSIGNIHLKALRSMSDYRKIRLSGWLDQVRLYIAGIGFFLLNVLLGVIGTFWFRTQQRSSELALRMVVGATRASVFRMLMAEGMAVLLVAFLPAALVFLNLMYLDVTQSSSVALSLPARFLFGMLFTVGVLALMIFIGIYPPARRAMRLQPADSLRDE